MTSSGPLSPVRGGEGQGEASEDCAMSTPAIAERVPNERTTAQRNSPPG
jgi:hypothetical protein